MEAETRLSTFTASDGDNLAVQDWPLPEGASPRGQVLLVHGLGEHAGRYDALARRLNGWGFAVRGYDHYGHGESGGPRGGLNHDLRLLEDLGDVIEATRSQTPRDTPLILLGHSLGGLVTSSFVARRLGQVDGLVLSSPALDIGLSPLQTWLLRGLARALPQLRVANGLKLKYLSHDPATVRAYQADPRCHNRISARLARFMAEHGPATVEAASRWRVPTLLLYAGDDHLVRPAGSRAFAAAAPSCVESQAFEALYHELFNESPELAAPVFERLREWLDKHFAPLPG
ncbi:lysophospholipase [Curvibacter sp. HBC61]|uniref:Lysophospholipase n=1 Tax=Curvibacter cyanobacteriorum TaxID=3026422 RepID=A0ABT5N344_9BURK|nr:alpha/beta hydrolase [Curvibacter sp. HBC61]MDD0839482.1 lysophospholipase [Curvibacter sp. HBC61]